MPQSITEIQQKYNKKPRKNVCETLGNIFRVSKIDYVT